ncbi:hypothetical protein EDB84DRAFT_1441095 [Lactarius hengduanensis]|nr:hypothetical protein EDB84DRAFT_1441095 [Lactarius hengduanensis]
MYIVSTPSPSASSSWLWSRAALGKRVAGRRGAVLACRVGRRGGESASGGVVRAVSRWRDVGGPGCWGNVWRIGSGRVLVCRVWVGVAVSRRVALGRRVAGFVRAVSRWRDVGGPGCWGNVWRIGSGRVLVSGVLRVMLGQYDGSVVAGCCVPVGARGGWVGGRGLACHVGGRRGGFGGGRVFASHVGGGMLGQERVEVTSVHEGEAMACDVRTTSSILRSRGVASHAGRRVGAGTSGGGERARGGNNGLRRSVVSGKKKEKEKKGTYLVHWAEAQLVLNHALHLA